MKKLFLLLPLVASVSSLNAQQVLFGGGTEMDSTNISGTYNQLWIMQDESDCYKGNTSTGQIVIESDLNTSWWPTFSNSYIGAEADYEFNAPVVVKNIRTANEMRYTTVYVGEGATLKFNNGLTTATENTASNQRFMLVGKTSSSKAADNVFGNIEITNTTGVLVDSSSSFKTSELILGAMNLTLKSSTNTEVYATGYMHFYFGSTLKLGTNVKIGTLAARSATTETTDRNIGSIFVNGKTFTCAGIYFNPDGYANIGDFTVDMGKDLASTFVCNGAISFRDGSGVTTSAEDYDLIFTNFEYGKDQILFKSKLSDSVVSMFLINGASGDDILCKEVTYNKETYYSYYVIPEPSTYAMIFGALALGFVAYRRRK